MTSVFLSIRVFIFMIASSLPETTNRIRIPFAGLLSSSAQYMVTWIESGNDYTISYSE